MKLGILKNIAHNLADSFSTGLGFMIGIYSFQIFEEVIKTSDRQIEIDFLNSKVLNGTDSKDLERVVSLYSKALRDLCIKHGVRIEEFEVLKIRFFIQGIQRFFETNIVDKNGRKSIDRYIDGFRPKIIDNQGRLIKDRRNLAL